MKLLFFFFSDGYNLLANLCESINKYFKIFFFGFAKYGKHNILKNKRTKKKKIS
jgi:hypothetical protein